VAAPADCAVVNGYLFVKYPTFGMGLLIVFLVYEVAQDHNTKDQCHQDILGHLVGLTVAAVAVLVLDVLGVL